MAGLTAEKNELLPLLYLSFSSKKTATTLPPPLLMAPQSRGYAGVEGFFNHQKGYPVLTWHLLRDCHLTLFGIFADPLNSG